MIESMEIESVENVNTDRTGKGSIMKRKICPSDEYKNKSVNYNYPDEQYWYMLACLLDRMFLIIYIVVIAFSTIMFKPWF